MPPADDARRDEPAAFGPLYTTEASPIHRAVWDDHFPFDLFSARPDAADPKARAIMEASLAVVRRYATGGKLREPDSKVSPSVLGELARVGYWGLRVDPAYGGSAAPLRIFLPLLTQISAIDGALGGLAAVHGCIGATNALQRFGTTAQKQQWLPRLAAGEALAAFALTEPAAGSDVTAIRTTATCEGDDLLITGDKLFITNAAPGAIVSLVCLFEGQPAVVIVQLPTEPSETFQFVDYGLHALSHVHNRGLRFNAFRVPASQLVRPPRGDGLTIAYHGLNQGRAALCANAAGTMRSLLAGMVQWANHRHTYGQPIGTRELVRRRLARLSSLIVGADAMATWCGGLLDAGYRGEMECIVAKIYASEALKEAAIELALKTHGGRTFLRGHMVGDHLHDLLAPCIYEGEGEILSLALFKSLVKDHGVRFLRPLVEARDAWSHGRAAAAYGRWLVSQRFRRCHLPEAGLSKPFDHHAHFAARELQRLAVTLSTSLRKHGSRMADRQCRMAALSQRVQHCVVMLCTAQYAVQLQDGVMLRAADLLCRDLQGKLTGHPPTDSDYQAANALGKAIAEGQFPGLADVQVPELLMPY